MTSSSAIVRSEFETLFFHISQFGVGEEFNLAFLNNRMKIWKWGIMFLGILFFLQKKNIFRAPTLRLENREFKSRKSRTKDSKNRTQRLPP